MRKWSLVFILVVLVASLVISGCTAKPDTAAAAEFYKGKTVTVLIPGSPGATFDMLTRAMAPYMEKYTGAKMLIQNSKNIEAENKLFEAKPDGLTIELIGNAPKVIAGDLFKDEGVKFDWTKFTLLARLPLSSSAFAVDKKLGWTKPSDMVGKQFFVGATTPFFEPLFAEAMGWDNMKVIPGLSGADRVLGMRRGELQAAMSGAAQVVADKDILLPLVVTTKDEKGFPGVPAAADVAAKGKEKWGKLVGAWDEVMYWSIATPGIAADRVAFLESALEKTYKDSAFVADVTKLKIDLAATFVGSNELKKIASTLASLSADDVKEMKFIINEKYLKK
jgi:hypothetical protein